MIRYVAALRRRTGTSRLEFETAWLGEHRALARALPQVRRVDFRPGLPIDGLPGAYDGVGFLDFDDQTALRASLASSIAKRLREHTATFADADSAVRLVIEAETAEDQDWPDEPSSQRRSDRS